MFLRGTYDVDHAESGPVVCRDLGRKLLQKYSFGLHLALTDAAEWLDDAELNCYFWKKRRHTMRVWILDRMVNAIQHRNPNESCFAPCQPHSFAV